MKIKKNHAWILGLTLSTFTIVSCSQDESLDLEEGTLSSVNSSLATPTTGNIYTIKNKDNNRTLDIENR